jgi:hypothetical protein
MSDVQETLLKTVTKPYAAVLKLARCSLPVAFFREETISFR